MARRAAPWQKESMPLHLVPADQRPAFPDHYVPEADGLAALGGRLSPELIVEAYRKGLFPWTGAPPIPWFSPDPRLVLFPDQLHVGRTLAKTLRRGHFTVRYDTAFDALMRLCARHPRPGQRGTWITPNMLETYGALHRRGVAHSVEAWQDGVLCGGLYGVALGRAFFGESMVSRISGASKVALVTLCRELSRWGFHFIDCQQVTAHLLRLGATPLPRSEYLSRLAEAVRSPDAWGGERDTP